ncbi:retron St85 family effector protein [Arsenophonus sp.]|uniref:retron St85 family effector protein n=1 Tax=Arsenophonus sp. TaxID=1872640 RepID=UPI002856C5D7|nr:retron St85 family effector protein [Arsenophonus sp.]MDR5615977.1 retron St85 family effector protein [Arsenophonus sp.]
MKKSFSTSQLVDIANVVKERIYVPFFEKKRTIFLCGADIKDQTKSRFKMACLFKENQSRIQYELLYPESLFDDLLAGQGQHSLLALENILASSVDAIVLLPESPGSFAELGAFSSNPQLVNKLICIANQRYKNKRSFLNYGPNRLIKASASGRVINLDYDKLSNREDRAKIFRLISDSVTKIQKQNPIKKNVTNILEAENFILPYIYLIENLDLDSLKILLKIATDQDDLMSDIATRSALTRLQSKRMIMKTTAGYDMTKSGTLYVLSKFRDYRLDLVRIEIMNFQYRGKAGVCYDRMSKRTFSELVFEKSGIQLGSDSLSFN